MMIYTQYSPFDDWFIFWFKMRPKFYKHRDEEGRERIFKCGNERLSLIIVRRSASSSVVVVVRLNYTLGIFNFEKSYKDNFVSIRFNIGKCNNNNNNFNDHKSLFTGYANRKQFFIRSFHFSFRCCSSWIVCTVLSSSLQMPTNSS